MRRWRPGTGARENLKLWVLAVLTGICACYGAVVFRLAIDWTQFLFYGTSSENVLAVAAGLDWWQLLLAPAVGGLGIGLFIHIAIPDRRPVGVAEVIEASALANGRMPPRRSLAGAVASALSIGAGASVGREGPVVHLAAAIASWFAQKFNLSRAHSLTLLGCGVASGVAASFNAPIAGVFFALEVVVGHYGLGAFAPVVVASVIGTLISRFHLGDYPAFILPPPELISFAAMPAFLLLGVVCALVAVSLMQSVRFGAWSTTLLPLRPWTFPALGGLGVGAIAIFYPEVIGVGYETTDAALRSEIALWPLLAILVAKIAATGLSLGSGFGGGIFSPSLCVGAVAGAAFGIVTMDLVPWIDVAPSAYAIVGMGAVAGAVLGAPISTMLIIFELTGDLTLTIGVMAATTVSTLLVRQWVGHSFFTWQLADRGVDLSAGYERTLRQSIPLSGLRRDRYRTLDMSTPVARIRELMRTEPHTDFYVTDSEDRLHGVLTFDDIKDSILDNTADGVAQARDRVREAPAVLAVDDDLDLALLAFGRTDADHLPLVDDLASCKLLGVIFHKDAIAAYNAELLRRRAEEHGES